MKREKERRRKNESLCYWVITHNERKRASHEKKSKREREESVSEGKRCFLKMKCNNQTSAWGFEAVLVIIFLPSFSPFFISLISLSLSVIAGALGRDSRRNCDNFLLQLRRKTGRGSRWGMKEERRIQILKETFFSSMMDDASLKERHVKETFRKNAFLGESKLRSSNFPHHNLSYFECDETNILSKNFLHKKAIFFFETASMWGKKVLRIFPFRDWTFGRMDSNPLWLCWKNVERMYRKGRWWKSGQEMHKKEEEMKGRRKKIRWKEEKWNDECSSWRWLLRGRSLSRLYTWL